MSPGFHLRSWRLCFYLSHYFTALENFGDRKVKAGDVHSDDQLILCIGNLMITNNCGIWLAGGHLQPGWTMERALSLLILQLAVFMYIMQWCCPISWRSSHPLHHTAGYHCGGGAWDKRGCSGLFRSVFFKLDHDHRLLSAVPMMTYSGATTV